MATFILIMIMLSALTALTSMDIFNEEMLEEGCVDWYENMYVQQEHTRLVSQFVLYAEESIQYRTALGWDTEDDTHTEWEEDTEEYEYVDDECELDDRQQAAWDMLNHVFTVPNTEEDDVKQAFKDGYERGARLRERVLGVVDTMNQQLREAEHAAQAACVQYVHDVRGMYHDIKHQAQQVVWYYRASKAKDVTPTKVVRVRPTVGGTRTTVMVQAAYELQAGGQS